MRTVKVFEIVHDTDGDGPMGDGVQIYRTRNEREAQAFAARNTCYGRPATVQSVDAPMRLVKRWGV